ncbi:MAG: MucR family transcriptional regulator [Rhizobiaceae bacterium]|nr:MucR family transcriptional regulator [Rhizobiaceae bacterium]
MENPIYDPVVESSETDVVLEMTAEVVAAYVSNNPVSSVELPNLIGDIYGAFLKINGSEISALVEKPIPAVPIKKSLHDDYLICLEDGKKFKSLKRHLRSHYDISPEEYREKWGLPSDYPMVAPAYAKERSRLAREMGLGRKLGTKIKK